MVDQLTSSLNGTSVPPVYVFIFVQTTNEHDAPLARGNDPFQPHSVPRSLLLVFLVIETFAVLVGRAVFFVDFPTEKGLAFVRDSLHTGKEDHLSSIPQDAFDAPKNIDKCKTEAFFSLFQGSFWFCRPDWGKSLSGA